MNDRPSRARVRHARALLAVGAGLALAACEAPSPTVSEMRELPVLTAQGSGATLVECPTDVTVSDTATVTPLGGSVTLNGHRIDVPLGAVLGPVKLTLTEPASNYMEIGIRAGAAEHFQFEVPVRITISYARCTRANIDKGALSAWYIDEASKALLEDMGGTDDKAARTVTFGTDHLSGYAIAN